eukprot:g11524.t1
MHSIDTETYHDGESGDHDDEELLLPRSYKKLASPFNKISLGCALCTAAAMCVMVVRYLAPHPNTQPPTSSPELPADLSAPQPLDPQSALFEYVRSPSLLHSWRLLPGAQLDGPGFTGYVLNMSGGHWLDSERVDRPDWWSYLTILVPNEQYLQPAFNGYATLHVTGGSNDDVDGKPTRPPSLSNPEVQFLGALAKQVGTVVALLAQTPNQPLCFYNDTSLTKSEDGLLAYSWARFLQTEQADAHWLVQLPMARNVYQAMGAITDFTSTLNLPSAIPVPTQFILSSASRVGGWAAWLAAAVDSERVVGLAPIAFPLLDIQNTLQRHWQALGGWSYALRDYWREGVLGALAMDDRNRSAALLQIVDPVSYAANLTMPKLIVFAANDEFFLPTEVEQLLQTLPGDNLLRVIPGDGQSLSQSYDKLLSLLTSFTVGVFGQLAAPAFEFSIRYQDSSAEIVLVSSSPVQEVVLYSCESVASSGRRDFRATVWTADGQAQPSNVQTRSKPINQKRNEQGRWAGNVAAPEQGWVMFYLEVKFRWLDNVPLTVTSPVGVLPQTFPFAPCIETDCVGQLV